MGAAAEDEGAGTAEDREWGVDSMDGEEWEMREE